MQRKTLNRTLRILVGAAFGLNLMTGAAFAAPSSDTDVVQENPSQAKYECPDEENLNNVDGHGANNTGGYQSTCDEADFGGNGQEYGPGNQTGKPCAGCVGNADDKNPPGQYPDGSDSNSGYECDGRDRPARNQQGNGNHGIGDENPAHTGCESTPVTPVCPDGSAMPADGSEDCPTEPELCPGTDIPMTDPSDCDTDEEPEEPVFCPGTTTEMTDVDGNGVINAADCNKVEPKQEFCPNSTTELMTDVDGNGVINAADCNKVEPEPQYCPDTTTEMTDVDGNGVINAADCNKVEPEQVFCPDTTTPMTDTNGDGKVTPADCNKVDEEPTPEPEVEVTEVLPVTIITSSPVVLETPAVAALVALDVQPEQVVAAPAAEARPTQVLGVQVDRANLARTGLSTDLLVLLAGVMLFVGALLVRTGRPSAQR